jgi:AcrR family transcriptional regulator
VGTTDMTDATTPLTAAQRRIVLAARELFVEHGVAATSLQMIADAIGVTKAAVYHQFRTKHDIVVASAEYEVDALEEALDVAEAEPERTKALDLLIEKAVDLAVRRRREVISLQGDPVMLSVLLEDNRFRAVTLRYLRFVVGGESPEARVRAAVLSVAIGRTVTNPLVLDIDDETLRTTLYEVVRGMVAD